MAWDIKEERTCTYLEGEMKKMEKNMKHEKRRAEGEIEFWRNKVFDLDGRSVESGENEIGNEFGNHKAEFSGVRHHAAVPELQTKHYVLNVGEVVAECPVCVCFVPQAHEHDSHCISSESPRVSCRGKKSKCVNDRVKREPLYESSSENRLGLSGKLHDKVRQQSCGESCLCCLTAVDPVM